jgi:hypothetical protein
MQPPKVSPNFTIPDLPNVADQFLKVYKLLKNLYGLKDARKTWADFLKTGLLEQGWKPSEVDSGLYTKNGIILILYMLTMRSLFLPKNLALLPNFDFICPTICAP